MSHPVLTPILPRTRKAPKRQARKATTGAVTRPNLTGKSIRDSTHEQTEFKFESVYVSLRLEEGILYCRYAPGLHLTHDVAEACMDARIQLSRGKHYPLLVDMIGVTSMSILARKYLAKEGIALVTACALVTGSAANKAMTKQFVEFDSPRVPIMLFSREEKAKQWLRRYLVRDAFPVLKKKVRRRQEY
jgi:hypothetical protein